jgi:hypothetical protein
MVTPFNLRRAYYSVINPIEFYASTLETLVLKDVEEGSDYEGFESTNGYRLGNWFPKRIDLLSKPCNFIKLRKLTQSLRTPLDNLKGSTFPVLTHLQLKVERPIHRICDYDEDRLEIKCSEIRKFFRLFPKLEVFMLHLNGEQPYSWENEPAEYEKEYLPKVKSIYLNGYFPEITNQFKETLEKFEIDTTNYLDISRDRQPQTNMLYDLLRDFKALKSLSIRSYSFYVFKEDELKPYETNESIENLKIFATSTYYNQHPNVQHPNVQKLLRALPSLKELVLHSRHLNEDIVIEEMLKFIGKRH